MYKLEQDLLKREDEIKFLQTIMVCLSQQIQIKIKSI